jgi:hypothetical protein
MKDHGIKADHCTFIALFMVSTCSHASLQHITACTVGLASSPSAYVGWLTMFLSLR